MGIAGEMIAGRHAVKPVLQALVIAEHIYQDITGKKVIAGTFNRVNFTRKPLTRQIERPDGSQAMILPGGMQSGSPFAYVNLTDVHENTKLLFRFVNLTKNEVLFVNEAVVSSKDRLQSIELVLPLPLLPIHEEGVYAFEVVSEGEILGTYRIAAEEIKTEEIGEAKM
jgi:hypothetical protein